MSYSWMPIIGNFEKKGEEITFYGGMDKDPITGKEFPKVGNYICEKVFGGGAIEAIVSFPKLPSVVACGIMFCFDTEQRYFVTASISLREEGNFAFALQHFDQKWTSHAFAGSKSAIREKEEYRIKVAVEGSAVEFFVNNVSVIKKNLPFQLPQKQVGLWCQGSEEIKVKDYKVTDSDAKAFIIMQFSTPYDELFEDVIEPICRKRNIKAIRADKTYGPGHILSDIMQEIFSAKFIIAEITPPNQNVFFEVGYAHAMKKPIIFIAEKGKDLPFDVSGFRVQFYENSIRGKKDIELGLEKNIDAILAGPFA